MKQRICAYVFGIMLFVACNKKEPATVERVGEPARPASTECAKEIITDQEVKVGETGIVLPAKTKLCFSADDLEIRIELPQGYGFMVQGTNKLLPISGTYSCVCSESGSCKVFYVSGMGFGCLHSTCSGSCTGASSYNGYKIEGVVNTINKTDFFNILEVQKEIAAISSAAPYSKHSVYGISFYVVNNESKFLAVANCKCDGTATCNLKSFSVPFGPKVYWCEGSCNGCELTVP